MPRFDGTGPRSAGMFTGQGEGSCALRLPKPGSSEPVVGHAGLQGAPVYFAPGSQQILASAAAGLRTRIPDGLPRQGRRCRCGRRRQEDQ